ncbi:MAG: transporter [Sandaracinaceae bacterium]
MPRGARAGLVLLIAAASLPSHAEACATCGCGDPTLTVMGNGTPFEGRLRVSLQAQARADRFGQSGVDRTTIRELQLSLAAAYAPSDRLVLSAQLPLVLRSVGWANGARATTLGPGDLELTGRVTVWQDRSFAPSFLVGGTLGVKLPTSLDHGGPTGRIPVDAQSGTGTIDPLAGLFLTYLADPWALFTSGVVRVPLAGRYEEEPGTSVRTTTAVQYRVDTHVTLRGAVDTRYDAPALVLGRRDPSTEHFALFLSPEVLWSPVTDLILSLAVRVPVLQVSGQTRRESPYLQLSAVLDA